MDTACLHLQWGVVNTNSAMAYVARDGNVDIVHPCQEWGASNYNREMACAANDGYMNIVIYARTREFTTRMMPWQRYPGCSRGHHASVPGGGE